MVRRLRGIDLSYTGPNARRPASQAVPIGRFIMCGLMGMALLPACATSLPSGQAPRPGTYEQATEFRFNGFRRTYLLHVPEGCDGSRPVPLVMAVHGAFSSAGEMERFTGFSRMADREGFVALYPNGIGLFGWLRHWNSGHCCAKAREAGIDDVGFLDAVLADVTGRLNIDAERIYLAGHSNGGMMTYRYAAERSGRIAAAAVVAGTIGGKPSAAEPEWRVPDPGSLVPIIAFHGTADPSVPYEGGPDLRGRGLTWISADASAQFWADRNGCPSPPSATTLYDGRVQVMTWRPCSGGATTTLYKLNGWGHAWPGPYFKGEKEPYPGDDFDAAAIIWDFFKTCIRQENGKERP